MLLYAHSYKPILQYEPLWCRYDLSKRHVTRRLRLHGISSALDGGDDQLFSVGHGQIDLAVDENGLWAIYSVAEMGRQFDADARQIGQSDSSSILVSLIRDVDDMMTVERTWSIAVPHRRFGNGSTLKAIKHY